MEQLLIDIKDYMTARECSPLVKKITESLPRNKYAIYETLENTESGIKPISVKFILIYPDGMDCTFHVNNKRSDSNNIEVIKRVYKDVERLSKAYKNG